MKFLLCFLITSYISHTYTFLLLNKLPNQIYYRHHSHLLSTSDLSNEPNKDKTNTLKVNTKRNSNRKDESDLILALSSRGTDVFDFSTFSMGADNNNEEGVVLTKEIFYAWEKQINALLMDLKPFKNKDTILSLYSSILAKASPVVLDPLQTATFELFVFSLVDNLISNHPDEQPITSLIQDITSVNIEFIDKFMTMIDDGGSDGYSQSARQEYLCYQFAGLMLKVYSRITYSLGDTYDITASTQELRLNTWVEPVLKVLESRCVRFLIQNVEDKLEEMYPVAFDKLLERIKIEVTPRYSLIPTTDSSQKLAGAYRDWEFANFMSKLLRNTISNIERYSLEIKIVRLFQSDLSQRMRTIGKHLERILMKQQQQQRVASSDKELKQVEEMLNLGHSVVSAVYLLWHVRYNIVGTLTSDGVTYVKDFILPVDITEYNKTLDCLPKNHKDEIQGEIVLLTERYPDLMETVPHMKSLAAICSAVRNTAMDEYRALITYNSNSDDWPESRDDIFIAVLSTFIYTQLTSPVSFIDYDKTTNQQVVSMEMIENIIALAALDESIGVREPRAAVTKAFVLGMQAAVATLFPSSSTTTTSSSSSTAATITPPAVVDSEEFQRRIQSVEFLLSIALRLPQGTGQKCRQLAFQKYIESFLNLSQQQQDDDNNNDIMSSTTFVFKQIEKLYPSVATALSIDTRTAQAYIGPLGLSKFDKVVGSMLMNADLAVFMPEMGTILQNQLYDFAEDIMITPEQADGRVLLIAAAVMQSFLETALEEGRRLSINNVETVLVKGYYLCQHPLIQLLSQPRLDSTGDSNAPSSTTSIQKASSSSSSRDVKSIAVKMTSKRIGPQLFIELVRLMESTRQRILMTADSNARSGGASGAESGWGGSGSSLLSPSLTRDPKFREYLSSLRTALLQEYSAGTVRKSFGR